MTDAPAVTALTWQPLGIDLVPQWHRLVEAITQADGGTEHLTADDLVDELEPEWIEVATDTLVALDAAGVARAFGLVQVRPGDVTLLRVQVWGGVDPEWRGRGVGRELLARQQRQAADVAARRRAELGAETPAVAWVHVEDGVAPAERLLVHSGFEAARVNTVMWRDLSQPLPEPPPLAQGLRLVPWSAELDDRIRLAHNEAFLDHWGFQPWDVATWQQWESGHRDFRGDWSFAVLDGDEVAGYAQSAGYRSDWEAQGFTEGWTSKLGVRRAWRGTGLAKVLLAASMRAFRADDIQYAGLDVDSENLSGAVRLYTGLGYVERHRVTQFHMEL